MLPMTELLRAYCCSGLAPGEVMIVGSYRRAHHRGREGVVGAPSVGLNRTFN